MAFIKTVALASIHDDMGAEVEILCASVPKQLTSFWGNETFLSTVLHAL